MNAVLAEQPDKPLRLDLGCGTRKQPDHTGVDSIAFDGVDVVVELGKPGWPWADSSVESAYCSHTLEHLTNWEGKWERTTFFNELWRVMKPGGVCTLIVPHWSSNRYYGDPTHREAFSEMAMYYLDPEWRAREAPHSDKRWNPNGYSCNWQCTWGYGMHQDLLVRNAEYQRFAMQFFKEACLDLHVNMVAKK